ncbi:hypothetical protein CEUSTIGMA_g7007.t1 [Chlamydomonas eustigma]|uniref:Uncharacterized protein n=1 Tax=Chlamydomonas eustigma TaxID=1157962 RepID=A0A250X924_9CHLO|nr:hypothetical protein CEUSTIGMA_g7007.t1 [Chlamydomonas eustigma]|eukprot:GAX79566.1 hypothetical protein CEUSTIGMA_g7007.t1 [Chlamydomonas eustigma]
MSALDEAQGLEKVLSRLAMTDDSSLDKVLKKLIPVVIAYLKSEHESTKKKVLEILSHVNKRVKGHPTMKLPLSELLPQLSLHTYQSSSPALRSGTENPDPATAVTAADSPTTLAALNMVRSFSLVYLEMAFERSSAAERMQAVGTLLTQLSQRPPQHRLICLRLALSAFEAWAGATVPSAPVGRTGSAALSMPQSSTNASSPQNFEASGAEGQALQKFPFLSSEQDRSLLMAYCLKYMLYQPRSNSVKANTPLAAAANTTTLAVSSAPPQPLVPCPGLSLEDVKMLEEKGATSSPPGVLAAKKAGILGFVAQASAALDPASVLMILLAAAADPHTQVHTRAEELMKRLLALDSPKPVVDLEDAVLMSSLMKLFHGNAEGPFIDESLPQDKRQQPASLPVRCRLMPLLTRSLAAANAFPYTVQTISECVYGTSTSNRLKQQGMEFAVWVFRHAADHQLKAMGPSMLQGLLNSLEGDDLSQATNDTSSLALKGFAYQAVGCLSQRAPQIFWGRTDVAELFFRALSEEPPGLRATVAEACSSLSNAFKHDLLSAQHVKELEKLLLSSIEHPKDTVRLCAVQWANRLFPISHEPSRYICVLATGDVKLEVREEGLRGLRLHTSQPLQPPLTHLNGPEGKGTETKLPPLNAMLLYLRSQKPSLFSMGTGNANRSLMLPSKSYLSLIHFAAACRSSSGLGDASIADSCKDFLNPEEAVPSGYLLLLEGALCRDSSGELCAVALKALLDTVLLDTKAFAHRYATRVAWLRGYLSHTEADVRLAASRLLGAASAGMTNEVITELLCDLTSQFHGIPLIADHSSVLDKQSASNLKSSSKFEEQEGCILATGFVLARCLSKESSEAALDAKIAEAAENAAASLCTALYAFNGQLSSAAAIALGLASLQGHLPGLQLRSVPEPVLEGKDAVMEDCTDMVGRRSKSKFTFSALLDRVSLLLADKDIKVAGRVATAAGYLLAGAHKLDDTMPLLEALCKQCTSKLEELQFSVGEAVAFAFGGIPISTDKILLSSYASLSEEFSLLKNTGPDSSAPPLALELSKGNNRAQESLLSDTEGHNQLVERRTWILQKLLEEMLVHSRAEVRCASSIWLVSLLTYCTEAKPLSAVLSTVQEKLGQLLGDSNELTQEMASRGISLVYNRGDEGTRKLLVEALVGILQGNGSKAKTIKLSADTKVFEEGALGNAPPSSGTSTSGGSSSSSTTDSSSLSTYKELCSLATDLGQPDLIYKFMDLAHHSQALNTRRGAAFGIAGIARLAGGQLASHMGSLIPKLYRYQYDPNQKVQDAMEHIWRSIVDEPRKAIDEHFAAIMQDLVKEMGGRLWRNRQASAAALLDLLQGRRWNELKPFYENIWSMALRCLDDIKETVRRQAILLVKSLSNLTVRLVDPQHSAEEDCREVVSQVLPLLLEQGLGSSVVEVRAVSLDCIARLAKAAKLDALRPHLIPLVQSMLEGLSSLEDARLNYIEQHADKMGLDQEKLESARVAASRSSPLGDTLEICSHFSDSVSLGLLAPALAGIIKRGVGLNTKVGTARFVKNLMTKARSEDARPHTPTLLRALVAGVQSERSAAVRKAFASAAAQVCKHASEKRIDKSIEEACQMYTGSSSDEDAKYAGGLIILELIRAMPEAVAAKASLVLPLAFSAKMDDCDKVVATVWKDVWNDGISSEAGAVRMYAEEIVGSLVEGLGSTQWSRKKSCAEAVLELTKLGNDILGKHGSTLASTLVHEIQQGRFWEGKHLLVNALGALCNTASSALVQQPGHDNIISCFLTVLNKKTTAMRLSALISLNQAISKFPGDYFDKVSSILYSGCEAHCDPLRGKAEDSGEEAALHMKVTSGELSAPSSLLPLSETVSCLASAFQRTCLLANSQQPHFENDVEMDNISGKSESTRPCVRGIEIQNQHVVDSGQRIVELLARLLAAHLSWQKALSLIIPCQTLLQSAHSMGANPQILFGWSKLLLTPIVVLATNFRVQQVRIESLVTLEIMYKCCGACWGSGEIDTLKEFLVHVTESERTGAVALHAGSMLLLLSGK